MTILPTSSTNSSSQREKKQSKSSQASSGASISAQQANNGNGNLNGLDSGSSSAGPSTSSSVATHHLLLVDHHHHRWTRSAAQQDLAGAASSQSSSGHHHHMLSSSSSSSSCSSIESSSSASDCSSGSSKRGLVSENIATGGTSKRHRSHRSHSHRMSIGQQQTPKDAQQEPLAEKVQAKLALLDSGPEDGSNLAMSSPSGYNSGDEYNSGEPVVVTRAAAAASAQQQAQWTQEQFDEAERRFEKKMRKRGLVVRKMGEDGACLFRAVADQVYGDQEMHGACRKLCMDYIQKNGDYFSQYVTEDFQSYVERKRRPHVHGNHVELQALSEIFSRPIEVFGYGGGEPMVYQSHVVSAGASANGGSSPPRAPSSSSAAKSEIPIRLSYQQRARHYDSLVDPFRPSVGLGLGLPSFSADHVVDTAFRTQEQLALEQAMLADKLRATDWEATSEALEEQVARESYLSWLRESEARRGDKVVDKSAGASPKRGRNSPNRSPKAGSSGSRETRQQAGQARNLESEDGSGALLDTTRSFLLTSSSSASPPLFYPSTSSGIAGATSQQDEEDEDSILARVLAESQREYLEQLRQNNSNSSHSATRGGNS